MPSRGSSSEAGVASWDASHPSTQCPSLAGAGQVWPCPAAVIGAFRLAASRGAELLQAQGGDGLLISSPSLSRPGPPEWVAHQSTLRDFPSPKQTFLFYISSMCLAIFQEKHFKLFHCAFFSSFGSELLYNTKILMFT